MAWRASALRQGVLRSSSRGLHGATPPPVCPSARGEGTCFRRSSGRSWIARDLSSASPWACGGTVGQPIQLEVTGRRAEVAPCLIPWDADSTTLDDGQSICVAGFTAETRAIAIRQDERVDQKTVKKELLSSGIPGRGCGPIDHFRLTAASRTLTAERLRTSEGVIRRPRVRMAGGHRSPNDACYQAGPRCGGFHAPPTPAPDHKRPQQLVPRVAARASPMPSNRRHDPPCNAERVDAGHRPEKFAAMKLPGSV